MKNFKFSVLAVAACLTACGGGGGGTNNTPASISGTSTGSTAKGASIAVSGSLKVTDPDAGQAVFKTPSSFVGTYGTFTFNASTGAWTYLIDNAKAATQALSSTTVASDTLTVTSSDGTATQDIQVTINGSSTGGGGGGTALVTSVPAPVYPSTDPYAAEKVAVFNLLNEDRARCGFGKVAQNALLDKAAQGHADYLTNNRLQSTHFQSQNNTGYIGYDPSFRFTYVGYDKWFSSEILDQQIWGPQGNGSIYSQSEKSATNTLRSLYASIYHLQGAMRSTIDVGIGISKFSQNGGGVYFAKTLNIDFGIPKTSSFDGQQIDVNALAHFPCDGTTGVNPYFRAENPDPFPNVNRDIYPYGQPVYLMSAKGTTISLQSWSIKLRGGASVPVIVFDKEADPNKILLSNEIFVVPTQRLADNSTYEVVLSGKNSGMISSANPTGSFDRSFSFTTGTFTSE